MVNPTHVSLCEENCRLIQQVTMKSVDALCHVLTRCWRCCDGFTLCLPSKIAQSPREDKVCFLNTDEEGTINLGSWEVPGKELEVIPSVSRILWTSPHNDRREGQTTTRTLTLQGPEDSIALLIAGFSQVGILPLTTVSIFLTNPTGVIRWHACTHTLRFCETSCQWYAN